MASWRRIFKALFKVRRTKPRGKYSYAGASTATRVSRWTTSGTSANTEILAGGPRMRNRVRDLIRNNPHARRIINVIVSRSVGTGIRPRFRTDDDELNKKALKLWEAQGKEIYTSSEMTVYGVQDMSVRAAVSDGGVLLRRRFRRMSDGLPLPYQVQVVETDYLDTTKDNTLPNGGRIVGGVEFDPLGRRKAYWLYKEHPGDQGTLGGSFSQSVRVLAKDIIYLHKEPRPGQVGDVPWLHAVVTALWDHHGYKDAERLRKRSEACLVATVQGGDEDQAAPGDEQDGIGPTPLTDGDGNPIEELSPGLVSYAPEGREVIFNQPKAIGGFAENVTVDLQDISAGTDVPYEMATQDLSRVNFSSIRMGGIQFRLEMNRYNDLWVKPILCDGLMKWFLEAAIITGELADQDYPVEWSQPAVEENDRTRDSAADKQQLRLGTSSLHKILANKGIDFDSHIEEIRAEKELYDELGITLDSDANRTSNAGITQKGDEAEEPTEEEPTEDDDAQPTDGSNALTLSK